MIELLDQSAGNVLGMRVSGKLLHEDYERFVPMLEELIEKHGSVRCFIEMVDLRGIELRALWDEIRFDVRHARHIERCAVVGDRSWEAWMTRLSRLIFVNAEIRYFDRTEVDEAWRWIGEEARPAPGTATETRERTSPP